MEKIVERFNLQGSVRPRGPRSKQRYLTPVIVHCFTMEGQKEIGVQTPLSSFISRSVSFFGGV